MRSSLRAWMLGLAALAPAAAASAQADNVLILIADDLGVDNVGVYAEGTNPPPTPIIDSLAARGVLFRNAWANPLCSPTRACLQTGRYSFLTGVGKPIPHPGLGLPPQNVLRLEEVSLPELLDAQGSGYSHAAIGKWHLGDARNGGALSPNLAGWSHYAGLLAGWADYYNWLRTVDGATATSTVYSTTKMVDDALSWISTASEPWVCYLAFQAPHDPFHAPPASLHTQNLAGLDPLTQPRPFYRAMVEAMDTEIGRMLNAMGPSLVARTNIVFLGDNGTPPPVSVAPFVGGHAKGTPYEGGCNVPLIVAGPAVVAPGREVGALVDAVDLFGTVAELCGVGYAVPPLRIDAVSVVPYLTNPAQLPLRSTVFAEEFDAGQLTTSGFATMRNARYKLIRWFAPTVREEFFDLVADPFETNNRIGGPLSQQEQQNLGALRAQLDRIRDTSGSFATFGARSCQGSNGAPGIGGTGTPAAGGSYGVTLAAAAAAQPATLLIGISDRQWSGLTLPFQLASIGGGPGCDLLASGELMTTALTSAAGTAAVQVPLPMLSTLVAATLYHGWVVVDPAAPGNPLGLTTSDGLRVTVGR